MVRSARLIKHSVYALVRYERARPNLHAERARKMFVYGTSTKVHHNLFLLWIRAVIVSVYEAPSM